MNRSNYCIIEESRLVPKGILDSVLKPTLEVRTPPYRLLPQYKNDPDLTEEGIISYITSAGYKIEYWYETVIKCVRRMARGDETANFLCFDYLITLYHLIKTPEMIKNEMEDMDETSVEMEYLNIPAGSSNKSYFKPVMFKRNLKKAFYPLTDENFTNAKKSKFEIERIDGEYRFVSIDISSRAGKANDNTVTACVRAIPEIGRGYQRHCVWMNSTRGQHSGIFAEDIKKIFFDFIGLTAQDEINRWANNNDQMDFIVMDIKNSGIGTYDSLSQVTICDDRGLTYPALGVVDERYEFIKQEEREDLRLNHTKAVNPVPIIFPINANQSLNSQIATSFRAALQKRLWNFLIAEGDAEEFLIKTNKEFMSATDSEIYARLMSPYVNTSLLVGECINLDMTLVSGMVKLVEKSNCLKDRFSAISYNNYVLSQFDHLLLKEINELDSIGEMMSLVQSV